MFGDSRFQEKFQALASSPASTDLILDSSPSKIDLSERTKNQNHNRPITDIRTNEEFDDSVTSIISALLSAVLALVVLLLVIFILQAVKRRRRERQGNLLNQPVIHAIAPPAFAPTMAAYTSRSEFTSSRAVIWESVASSSAPVIHPVDSSLEDNGEAPPHRHDLIHHHHPQQQHNNNIDINNMSINPVEVSISSTTDIEISVTTSSSSASASSSSELLSPSSSQPVPGL